MSYEDMYMYPMKIVPVYKDYLWGGNRLEKIFNKHSGFDITAESWELSCHKDGLCTVENGIFKNMKLSDVLYKHPEFVSKNYKQSDRFPIMVKLIDAAKDLSVQVHPSDKNAIKELGESGKAEMWYIVKADPRSYIYWGFNKRISKDQLIMLAETGEICNAMNKVYVNEGDVFYILPGTIHAIGSGCLIAEIQQSSNTTFRVFDYNRVGADGKKRQLHLDRAVEVLNYEPFVPDKKINNNTVSNNSYSFSNIFECEYLKVSKVVCRKSINLNCSWDSFYSLLFIDGAGKILFRNDEYSFSGGDSYFIPAGMGDFEIIGNFTALLSSV